MTFTYTWVNPEQTSLKRADTEGNVNFVPVDPDNRDYAEFLLSEATAVDYVAPPDPSELTAAEKLANAGLTVDELKTLLDL
jgi:hypothetical protein